MSEVVEFPSAESILVRALPDRIGVDVSTSIPSPRPPSFVRVKRVGGIRRNLVTDSAYVVIECWAPTDAEADDLGRLTHAHVYSLEQTDVDGDYVRAVSEIGGLQSFPDPETGAPRYQFTAQIDLKGVAI